MKLVLFLATFFIASGASADVTDFEMFDNFDYFANQQKTNNITPLVVDGKLGDLCLKVSQSVEQIISENGGSAERTAELIKMLDSAVEFTKFCIQQKLISK